MSISNVSIELGKIIESEVLTLGGQKKMNDAYLIIAFLWVVGWLYTRGLAWMVSKYEHWESESNLEKKSSNEMSTFFGWPWVLGMLHAPAFIDKKFSKQNKKSKF